MVAQARRLVAPIAALAAGVMFLLYNPWVVVGDSVRPILTVVFWVSFVVVLALLFTDRKNPNSEVVEVEGPAFTRYLFGNTTAGLFWLPIRFFLGFEWLIAGWGKVSGHGYIDNGGASLLKYWQSSVAIPDTGKPSITFEWYRTFLQMLIDNHTQTWFAWIVAFGELAVGIALLTGALVGIAAFFGATMNVSYMLAGSNSTNPILFALTIGVILSWRVAGYYGVDRFLLPLVGVPWHRAKVVVAAPAKAAPPASS
jgi:thiosulfate dehydrogenase [quinone] large subunit